MEQSILAVLLTSREAYNDLKDLLKPTDLSDEGNLLYEQIVKYYERDSKAEYIDKDVFTTHIERAYPKHARRLASIIQELSPGKSVPNVIEAFVELKLHRLQLELSSALINNDKDKIDSLIERYIQLTEQEEITQDQSQETLIGSEVDIADLSSSFHPENLIKIYPKSLNDKVDGGLLRGHHMLIFARPEVGKSMFAINMSCGFLTQGLKVLYLINEDPAKSIYMRHVSRLSGLSKFQVLDNLPVAHSKALEAGMSNVIIKGMSPGTAGEIDGLVAKYQPDVVIVDQLRNVKVRNMEGGLVHALEANAIAMRNLAKRRQVLVVSVTQAGDSASNKLVLDMSDVDSSKTGVPAAVDLMVGMGANADFLGRQQRMLSLCKNKLSGDHSYFPVQVDEALSKVNSL